MSRSPRNHGRTAPQRSSSLFKSIDFSRSSLVIYAWIVAILVTGLGPLAIISIFEVTGFGRNMLVALGPALVCVYFGWLVLVYGTEYGAEVGWSRQGVRWLAGIFFVLAVLVGWGLFVSV